MTDYTALGNAIKTTLEADSFFQVASGNVKTIEVYMRDFQFQDDGEDQFFEESELPAINIEPNAEPKEEDLTTVGEILETIRGEIMVVSSNTDVFLGRQKHDEIINNLERVLSAQKTSAKNLGIDAFVRDVATAKPSRQKKDNKIIFVSITSFSVELTATY